MNITKKILDEQVKHLNNQTNNPIEAITYDSKTKIGTWNKGCYCLDAAYNGYQLAQVYNESGAMKQITDGYVSKRELYEAIKYIRLGIQIAK